MEGEGGVFLLLLLFISQYEFEARAGVPFEAVVVDFRCSILFNLKLLLLNFMKLDYVARALIVCIYKL